MSEYGFQGMPSLNTFKKFCDEEELSFVSASVKNHQKHSTGYETIQKYLEKDYRQPKDFEDYIYVSQLLQAEGIKTAIEAHRKAKPTCMGTLYWQLNDCWPVTSWSSTDYYGNWKALHYFAKKAYKKVLVSAENENGNLMVYVVSDELHDLKVRCNLQLIDFDGKTLWKDSVEFIAGYEKSEKAYSISLTELLKGISPSHVFLKMRIEKNKNQLAENIFYFVKPKELLLDKPNVHYTIRREKDKTVVMLSSDKLAKNICIDFDDLDIKLTDNYFDLLPGESRAVTLETKMSKENLSKKIKIKSLVDSY
jgi:beta-mannosidase